MNREIIDKGDILVSDNKYAFVKAINDNGIKVYIDGKKDIILWEQLDHWKFANPIKDGRIISSKTFAVRFKQFLEWIPKSWWMSQPHYYEEYEYMNYIANQLLKYQIQTAIDKEEIDYLKRLELL